MRSGCVVDSATAREDQFGGSTPRPFSSSHARARHAGSRYAAMRSSRSVSIRAAKIGRMLNVNGSFRFIWNTRGRHDTCGHTSMPSARAAMFAAMMRSCHG